MKVAPLLITHKDDSKLDQIKVDDTVIFRLGRNVGKYDFCVHKDNAYSLHKRSDPKVFQRLKIVTNSSTLFPIRGTKKYVINTIKEIYKLIDENSSRR